MKKRYIAIPIFILAMLDPEYSFAANLTDIYRSQGMQGSMDVVNNVPWIGTISMYLISIMGLFSNLTIFWRKIVTVMYLSGRSFWDHVDDVKNGGDNNEMNMDRVINTLFRMLPNIKKWSDYNGMSNLNLTEEDDVWAYIAKTFIGTISIILFSTLAFNGTLGIIYADITDALAVGFKAVDKLKMVQTMEYLTSRGQGYNFTYSMDNTEQGAFKQALASDIYMQVSVKTGLTESTDLMRIGGNLDSKMEEITSWVKTQAESGNVGDKIDLSQDKNWSGVSESIKLSPTNVAAGNDKFKTIPFSELGVNSKSQGNNDEWYVVISVTSKELSQNKFQIDTSK